MYRVIVHLITLNDTQILGTTPLDEGSALRRDQFFLSAIFLNGANFDAFRQIALLSQPKVETDVLQKKSLYRGYST